MNTSKENLRIVILQHRLLHYRTSFFERLKKALADEGVVMDLVHGQASRKERSRRDEGSLSWAIKVTNRYLRVGATDLCWQPHGGVLQGADLIVMIQENRVLSNYPLLLARLFRSTPLIAFWGHGINFQSKHPRGWRERFKLSVLRRVDWWFAYTRATVDVLKCVGYPDSRITCLNNSVDNTQFIQDLEAVSNEKVHQIKCELGFGEDVQIALFCGSLYLEKRIDLLVDAADLIRKKIPNLGLIVVGDGPGRSELLRALDTRPWARWVGVQRGADKALYYKLASIVLNPGALGLHVLDAFVAGLPIVSTADAKHGPEIVYIEHGKNGYLTDNNAEQYAEVVVDLLSDEDRYRQVCQAAKAAGDRYSMDAMVDSFVQGVKRCLTMSGRMPRHCSRRGNA